MHLLQQFSLVRTQVIRLQGELLKPIPAESGHQLKVEIKLTPSTLPAQEGALPEFQLGCRMHCMGHLQDRENDPLFQAEVLMNAIYRQMQGEPLDFETFSRLHGQFNRQLYPLMRQWLLQQLLALGIGNVQLPNDLFTEMEGSTQELDSSGPENTRRLH